MLGRSAAGRALRLRPNSGLRQFVEMHSQMPFPFSTNPTSLVLREHVSRREWLRVGGLGALGLSLGDLLGPVARGAAPAGGDVIRELA